MTFSSVQNAIRILAVALAATSALATASHAQQPTDPNTIPDNENLANQAQQQKQKELEGNASES